MKNHFQMFAAYNRWANELMYDAAHLLPHDQYRSDQGSYFGSIHNTLNHILVGDRIWLSRFMGQGEAPSRLDEILFEDFELLRMARRAEDAKIIEWVNSLNDQVLFGSFSYKNTSGERFRQILATVLPHFFNHQTHHRGQVHCMLTGLGASAPSMDMIYFQRQLESAAE